MKINILMFAGLRDYFGGSAILELNKDGMISLTGTKSLITDYQSELSESAKTAAATGEINISEIREFITSLKPEAKSLLNDCRAALNNEFSDDESPVTESDELMFLPPSSGG